MLINPSGTIKQGIPLINISGINYYIITGPCIIQPQIIDASGNLSIRDNVAPLIVDQNVIPNSGIINNASITVSGITYIYDEDRAKWLSANRINIGFGAEGLVTNSILRQNGVGSNIGGLRMFRDATITSISATTDTVRLWRFAIFRNRNIFNSLFVSPIIPVTGASIESNIDLDRGDTITCVASGTNIPSPQVWLEVAWRGTARQGFRGFQ